MSILASDNDISSLTLRQCVEDTQAMLSTLSKTTSHSSSNSFRCWSHRRIACTLGKSLKCNPCPEVRSTRMLRSVAHRLKLVRVVSWSSASTQSIGLNLSLSSIHFNANWVLSVPPGPQKAAANGRGWSKESCCSLSSVSWKRAARSVKLPTSLNGTEYRERCLCISKIRPTNCKFLWTCWTSCSYVI